MHSFEIMSLSEEDHCFYVKKAIDGSLLILIIYVDDMLLAGKCKQSLDALKVELHKAFEMKDLGIASHILGMHIHRDREKRLLYLSQKEYIGKVLERFHMQGAKALSTPLPTYCKLSQDDSPKSNDERAEMSKIPYASAVLAV